MTATQDEKVWVLGVPHIDMTFLLWTFDIQWEYQLAVQMLTKREIPHIRFHDVYCTEPTPITSLYFGKDQWIAMNSHTEVENYLRKIGKWYADA